jgi:hypothetical protein
MDTLVGDEAHSTIYNKLYCRDDETERIFRWNSGFCSLHERGSDDSRARTTLLD